MKTKQSRRNVLVVLAILMGSMTAGVAQAQHTSTSRNKSGTTKTTTTTTTTKSNSTTKKNGQGKSSSSTSGKTTTTSSSGNSQSASSSTYTFNGHGVNDVSAFTFYDKPMAVFAGASRETTFKDIQKFMKKQYPKVKRDEKKNDYIKTSPMQGYYLSYCGVVPDYVRANFVNKKLHSYSYYFAMSKTEFKEQDIKAFVRKMQQELSSQGVKMKEVTPDGHNLFRATYEGSRNVALTYEDLGQYYGVQLWVSY